MISLLFIGYRIQHLLKLPERNLQKCGAGPGAGPFVKLCQSYARNFHGRSILKNKQQLKFKPSESDSRAD